MNWLKTFQAPRFYRYFFYRFYVVSKGLNDDQPAFGSTIAMSITISLQLSLVFFGFGALLDMDFFGMYFTNNNPLVLVFFSLLSIGIGYLMFYYNGKWKGCVDEFKDESEKQRTIGKYLLIIYLFINVFVLLRCTGWFIELTSPYYD